MNEPPRIQWGKEGQQQLLTRAEAMLHKPGRSILGIAGPPGAGKSTISAWLYEHLTVRYPREVAVVPMDGFHLAQSLLQARGLEHRKGAPDTFDGAGYIAILHRLRAHSQREVLAPTFRRDIEDPIAGAIPVAADVRLIITEGNYLLLDEEPWNDVAPLLDEVWFVELDSEERVRRLTARHMQFDRDLAIAEWRATGNDERNAVLVAAGSHRSNLIIEHTPTDMPVTAPAENLGRMV